MIKCEPEGRKVTQQHLLKYHAEGFNNRIVELLDPDAWHTPTASGAVEALFHRAGVYTARREYRRPRTP